MYISWKHLLLGIVGAPVAGLLVAWLGFFNVGASTGHWKITDWFLHFAMRAAVRTYALAVEIQPIDDPAMLQPAAGHYARGCALCHGAPGEPRSAAIMHMLPQPPDLARVVGDWSDAELFRIVKHGVRFTGMPAWPSQHRDDEAWAMVAFLRQLPTLEPARYLELAHDTNEEQPHGVGDAFETALANCADCHGRDGLGRSRLVPIIAGQREAYLLESLQAYAEGRRASGTMAVAATAGDAIVWPELARYFAEKPWPPSVDAAAGELVSTGQRIAERGVPAHDVPACLSCHDGRRNPVYPRLDGQHAAYLATQLGLFQAGKRGGTRYAELMAKAAKGLTPEEIRAVAAYFSTRRDVLQAEP